VDKNPCPLVHFALIPGRPYPPPDLLQDILRDDIRELMDLDALERSYDLEQAAREELQERLWKL